MQNFLMTATVGVAVFLGIQTHETVTRYGVSLTCGASQAACVSLGPLGGVNAAGVRFWMRTFVHHGAAIPNSVENLLRNHGRRGL